MPSDLIYNKLSKKFYTRKNVLEIAKDLLGKYFVKKTKGEFISGKIVEVEAYDGSIDEAAHSFNSKTKRNEVMFKEGGYLYVYFIYGMYFCANIVTGLLNQRTAILIRGIEPIEGIETMFKNKFGNIDFDSKKIPSLTNGPGKICLAFDINKSHNGTDLMDDEIFLVDNKKIAPQNIAATKRIGIKKSQDLLWRFYIKDNPFVSQK
ncbi:MAG: DNA-3-methyladenine glycosylase [Ignavibacteria bacterium]|jgi:DNA-3-methyladenine glycosylase